MSARLRQVTSWIAYEEMVTVPQSFRMGEQLRASISPQPVDVYFIGDFSGSKGNPWKNGKMKLDVAADH
ncbi:hypothetical protein O9993_18975 [Vibrio lentus]|nr:hypothetical protein [Vibrio lentus]